MIPPHSRQISSGKINQEWDLSLELSARRHVAEDNYKHDLPWVYVDLVKGECCNCTKDLHIIH